VALPAQESKEGKHRTAAYPGQVTYILRQEEANGKLLIQWSLRCIKVTLSGLSECLLKIMHVQ